MKRLLYVITNADLGGAQSHLIDLVSGFQRRYQISVVCGEAGPMTERLRRIGIPVYIQPSIARSINPLLDVVAVLRLCRLIRKLVPDLIHAHSSKAGLLARIAAFLTRIPCIFTVHGWGFTPGVSTLRRRLVWLSEALMSPLAARVICVSNYDLELALRSLPATENRFLCIPNGIPDQERHKTAVHEGPVTVAMIARFNQQKDQQSLLRAFAKSDCDARLLLIGAGPTLESCKELALTLGIAEKVEFLGERRDVPSLLIRIDIVALISWYEGLPISLLEAMRAGLPVIATHVGGVPEQVEHAVTGYLVAPGDVTGIATTIATLVADRTLRKKLGEAGRHKFRASFTVDGMLLKTQAVYDSILYR